MVSITLSVPEEVRRTMKDFPEINWSHIVRQAITERADQLKFKREMLAELSEDKDFNEWSVNLGQKAKQGRNTRLK